MSLFVYCEGDTVSEASRNVPTAIAVANITNSSIVNRGEKSPWIIFLYIYITLIKQKAIPKAV